MAIIHNITTDTTIVATHYGDTVLNYAGGVMVSTGSGNDSIYSDVRDSYKFNNEYGYVTIDAGSGNDKILSTSQYVSINGGVGADSISIGDSDDVTITGGPGNDSILGSGENKVYRYSPGDGNDVIIGYSSTDKIMFEGNNDYSTVISGSNVIVNVYKGKITLKNAADTIVNIEGGNLVDDPVAGSYGEYITNSLKGSVLTGSSYSDTVYNYGSNVNVSVGAETDIIYNSGAHTTVDAGEGNDIINNQTNKSSASLSGGAGDDSIHAGRTSAWVTLNGGTGNDTLVGSDSAKYGDIYQFANTDGNDIIINYETNDTIQFLELEDITSISYYKSGSDFIFDVDTENRITLKNAGDKKIQVELADGSSVTLLDNYSLPGPDYENEYTNVQSQNNIPGTLNENLITNSGSYTTIETENDTTIDGGSSTLTGGSTNVSNGLDKNISAVYDKDTSTIVSIDTPTPTLP
ncbi:MAG: hypothetical protein IJ563_08535, partial [Selenomonadaceae bacterium]|nr:hypothetical protein [Selenomonadaceae bacterium]